MALAASEATVAMVKAVANFVGFPNITMGRKLTDVAKNPLEKSKRITYHLRDRHVLWSVFSYFSFFQSRAGFLANLSPRARGSGSPEACGAREAAFALVRDRRRQIRREIARARA